MPSMASANRPLARGGFGLVDLCVLLVLLTVSVPLLLIATGRAREASCRSGCASQLAKIYLALESYSNADMGKYPRTAFVVNDPVIRAYTGVNAAQTFGT